VIKLQAASNHLNGERLLKTRARSNSIRATPLYSLILTDGASPVSSRPKSIPLTLNYFDEGASLPDASPPSMQIARRDISLL